MQQNNELLNADLGAFGSGLRIFRSGRGFVFNDPELSYVAKWCRWIGMDQNILPTWTTTLYKFYSDNFKKDHKKFIDMRRNHHITLHKERPFYEGTFHYWKKNRTWFDLQWPEWRTKIWEYDLNNSKSVEEMNQYRNKFKTWREWGLTRDAENWCELPAYEYDKKLFYQEINKNNKNKSNKNRNNNKSWSYYYKNNRNWNNNKNRNNKN